ncbi:hypothetical protein WA158_005066 [Blastocystis sp. Blastoise]
MHAITTSLPLSPEETAETEENADTSPSPMPDNLDIDPDNHGNNGIFETIDAFSKQEEDLKENKTHKKLQIIETCLISYLLLYSVSHPNLFSLLLLLLLFLYALPTPLNIPINFIHILSFISYIYIILKYIIQSDFINQNVSPEGQYYFEFFSNNTDTPFVTSSFQYVFLVGLYKTDNDIYTVPPFSHFLHEIILVILLFLYKQYVRSLGLGDRNIINCFIEDSLMKDIEDETTPVIETKDSNNKIFIDQQPYESNKFMKKFLNICPYSIQKYLQITIPNIYKLLNNTQPLFKDGKSYYAVIYMVIQVAIVVMDRIFFTQIFNTQINSTYSKVNDYANRWCILFIVLQLFYITTSALQIKHGYPSTDNTIKNLLTEDYGWISRILYYIYLYIPFLFELHQLIDWLSTDTVLDPFSWIRLEEIKATLFQAKCRSELVVKDVYKNQGIPRGKLGKIGCGGSIILGIIFVLLLPLILFSSDSVALISNPVKYASLTISLQTRSQYISLYSFQQTKSVELLNEEEYYQWQLEYLDAFHSSVLTSQWQSSAQIIHFPDRSISPWSITSSVRNQLYEDMKFCNGTQLILSYTLHRNNPSGYEDAKGESIKEFSEEDCLNMLELFDFRNNITYTLGNVYPSLFRLSSTTDIYTLETIVPYNNLTVQLLYDEDELLAGFTFHTVSDDTLTDIVAEGLSMIGSVGITGLYITILFTLGSVVKNILIPRPESILYFTLQDPASILSLLHGLYICRLLKYPEYLNDEYSLFNLIVRVFRSPEVLTRVTGERPTRGVFVLDEDQEVKEHI